MHNAYACLNFTSVNDVSSLNACFATIQTSWFTNRLHTHYVTRTCIQL